MARCAICKRAAYFGNNVSYSHGRSDRIWKANVKSVKIKTESNVRRMYICASYLRSNFVERV